MAEWDKERDIQGRKKRRGRWAYLEDFRRNAAGEMVYTGARYAYSPSSPLPRKKLLLGLWVTGVASLAACVVQGLLPIPEMRGHAYVSLPYAGALVCAFATLWATAQLSFSKEPLREYVYNPTVKALPLRTMLTAVFSGATLLGDVIYLAVFGTERLGVTLLFLAMALLSLAGGLGGWLLRRKAVWDPLEREYE